MTTLTDEQIDAVFDYFDLSNDGQLSQRELKTALQILKVDLTDDDLKEFDLDGDNSYNKEEFKKLYEEKFQEVNFRERLQDSLMEFDPDKTGIITRDTLVEILMEKGDNPMTEEDIDGIFEELDTNKDGIFNLNDVINLLYPADTDTDVPETTEEAPADEEA